MSSTLDDHVTEIDADSEADGDRPRCGRARAGHRALNFDAGFDGADDGAELDKRTVTHQLDDASVMTAEDRFDDLLAHRFQPRDRFPLIQPTRREYPTTSASRWRRAFGQRG